MCDSSTSGPLPKNVSSSPQSSHSRFKKKKMLSKKTPIWWCKKKSKETDLVQRTQESMLILWDELFCLLPKRHLTWIEMQQTDALFLPACSNEVFVWAWLTRWYFSFNYWNTFLPTLGCAHRQWFEEKKLSNQRRLSNTVILTYTLCSLFI